MFKIECILNIIDSVYAEKWYVITKTIYDNCYWSNKILSYDFYSLYDYMS